MSPIKFGTDGWRALMDKDFTFQNVEILAQAFSDYMNGEGKKGNGSPKIVIGYDYRKNSENFAKSFTEVMVGNGLKVLLSNQPCPTPAVSYTIVSEKYDAGIAITASHNPAGYNGVKIKTDWGGSADKIVTDAVERLIGKNPVKKLAFSSSNPEIRGLNANYLTYLKKYLRLDAIRNAPFNILVDSMHGVGAAHIEDVLAGGKIKVKTIRSERDLNFGGHAPEPIPNYLKEATEIMKRREFDLCVVTDGDADRVGAIRPGGEFITPGIILSLILIHFCEDLGKKGNIVTTVSNTGLLYKVAKKHGLKVYETPVGFKYVSEIMRREPILLGGEESGGLGFPDYMYERDGMLSGLLLMQMMAMRGKTIDEILNDVEREFGKLFYTRKDTEYPNDMKPKLFKHLSKNPPKTLEGQSVIEVNSKDGMKFILKDGSWLLYRLSGTEPLLRIYSEATSPELAERLVDQGRDLAFNLPVTA